METGIFQMIETPVLLSILIVFPFLAALVMYGVRSFRWQAFIVVASGAVLIGAAMMLIPRMPLRLSPAALFGIPVHAVVKIADFLLLLVILFFGLKHRHRVIQIFALLQIVILAGLDLFSLRAEHAPTASFYGDNLSLIMVLIISIVGSIICVQSLPYMQAHEDHLKSKKSTRHRFFAVMLLFLGAMNGVVLSNDMGYFYFFFEVTTLCSFLLIGHDGTPLAVRNALRALWMNSLGGLVFVLAMVAVFARFQVLELQQMIAVQSGNGIYLLAPALLILAAFTKSAQFPFQSWLLGAMVAPTPVSALLHSSTMVKVGVYLVLRLAPGFRGTFLSESLAVFGAFTFLAAAALAVGQSNGKKVLAYSTISNLGLIFACAGLNTPAALTAGILLIIFHAVTKALLFLCVGTIEQRIASRDIEDMRGFYAKMPITALITVLGVIMMIMPPFGLLLGKWMAMESAAHNLYVILMVALGSALTVMYWARWAGTLMSDPFAGRFTPERQPWATWGALGTLAAGACFVSVAAPWLYLKWFTELLSPGYLPPYQVHGGILENPTGAFAVFPLACVAAVGFTVSIVAVRRATRARIIKPYLSGLQTGTPGMFTGPLNQSVRAEASNYYLSSIFGEKRLTTWMNLAALVLLTLLIGGAL
jgi:ech hydrogenase subunit A